MQATIHALPINSTLGHINRQLNKVRASQRAASELVRSGKADWKETLRQYRLAEQLYVEALLAHQKKWREKCHAR